MQAGLDEPADPDRRRGVRASDDESELALLAQFTRHESVAALAQSIAKSLGVRGADLIDAAGLGASRRDNGQCRQAG